MIVENPTVSRVIGLDCSTNSLAFAIIEDQKLVTFGEFVFEGKNVYSRATDALHKTEGMLALLEYDYIAIEKTIRVRAIDTAIKMAMVAGTVIAVLGKRAGVKVVEVPPISWQSYIGNKAIVGAEKRELLRSHPEQKTKAQQTKFVREFRKNRTIEWVRETFDTEVCSDNVSDAIGVAYFASEKLAGK